MSSFPPVQAERLAAPLAGRKDYGRALWCILNFLVWFDLFVRNRDYKKYLQASS